MWLHSSILKPGEKKETVRNEGSSTTQSHKEVRPLSSQEGNSKMAIVPGSSDLRTSLVTSSLRKLVWVKSAAQRRNKMWSGHRKEDSLIAIYFD